MYQYILCLSKLPRAWADILLLRSGVLQPGLQYSKVTTGRVCAFGKVWGERGACGEEVGWRGGGIKAVMGRQMKLSLCSHVYSTFFHHAHTTPPPLPPFPRSNHARIHSSACRPHPSRQIRRRQQTCKRARMNTDGHYPFKYNAWVFYLWRYLRIFVMSLSRM